MSEPLLNLAAIHEAIAAAMPERDCIVTSAHRFSWRETSERTRRLADLLRAHGLGCKRPRAELAGHESGQDHVALYLYNGNEYLEGMLGAYKARCAPFNVNYRYVDAELVELLLDADARVVIFDARFAERLAAIRARLPQVVLWLEVGAEGEPTLPGALDYEAALAQSAACEPEGLSPDDLYILYTGGTTGKPKGVLWRQEDIFLSALWTAAPPASLDELAQRALARRPIRVLPAPPFMHGAAHWVAFNMWNVGGTVVIQRQVEKLDAADLWSTVEREAVTAMTIVGDAFARPLLDELDRAQGAYDTSSLRLLSSGGAVLSAQTKRALIERMPKLKIVDRLGSSESGLQASHSSSASGGAESGRFQFTLAEDSLVLREDLSGCVAEGSDEIGWLARRGRVPLGYYKDAAKTAQTFPVIDGVRYVVPGDRAAVEADGSLRLLGRDSVTINSGGEKIYAEEVEHALKTHPAVYDAIVVGMPSERWGQQVTALLELRAGVEASDEEIRAHAAQGLAAYKLPKQMLRVARVFRSASGKADYRWAKATAGEQLGLGAVR